MNDLFEGMWSGCSAVLVGGGSSLQGFDWERLERWGCGEGRLSYMRRVAIINDAIHTCGHFADLLFWMDREQYDYRKTEMDNFRGIKAAYSYEDDNRGPEGTHFIQGKAAEGVSDSLGEGLCHANNSGYMLLNLVYLLGANPIYLLGFDGGVIGEAHHWHHAPRLPDAAEVQQERSKSMREGFEKYGGLYAGKGVEVVNLSPQSRIEVFPKKELDEVLPKQKAAMTWD